MASTKRNRQILIDKDFLATLSLAKEGILHPVDKLMTESESKEVEETGYYKGKPFPFPFIFAPSGEANKEVLMTTFKGEPLDFVVDGKIRGTIIVDEVFPIDPKKRIEQIFGTYDTTNPETKTYLKRLGNIALCGEYELDFDDIKNVKAKIAEAKEQIGAKNVSALMLDARPFHRAHERVIRITLEKSDLLIIFLLKPYKKDILPYELRLKAMEYFVDNFLPKNKVIVVPFENTYLFMSYKNAILDSICANNFGCNKIVMSQNHSGIGMHYDKNEMKSILNQYEDLAIDIEIITEFVYCDECKALISLNTCPHGAHHHIKYNPEAMLEILKVGMLPPSIFMRKDVSALLLSEIFKNRFENVGKIYDALFPNSGLLETHDEKDFYMELLKAYETIATN